MILYIHRNRSSLILKYGALESHLLAQSAQREASPRAQEQLNAPMTHLSHHGSCPASTLNTGKQGFGVMHQAPAV